MSSVSHAVQVTPSGLVRTSSTASTSGGRGVSHVTPSAMNSKSACTGGDS